jgi:hypothetical protein
MGKLTDSTGPRLALSLAFVLLLSGYLGIKAIYDASGDSPSPAGGGTLFALILFESLSGIGSDAGYSAALNTIVRSFPDKVVSSDLGSSTSTALTLSFDVDNHRFWCRYFRIRIVRFPFFYDRARFLSRKYFRFSAHSSGRDSLPNGTWLVLDSPLSISRTRSTNDHRKQQSRRIRKRDLYPQRGRAIDRKE